MENIDKIYKIIDEKIKEKQYTQDEIARLIYIELARYFTYDNDYFLKSKDELISKQLTSKNAICINISELYENILKKYNIQAKTIIYKNNQIISKEELKKDKIDKNDHIHAYNEFQTNTNYFKADLAKDFSYVKAGLKTKNFLIRKCVLDDGTNIYLDNLKYIDDKIGYTQYGMYVDDALNNIKQEINLKKQANQKQDQKDFSLDDINKKFNQLIDFNIDYIKDKQMSTIDKSNLFQTIILLTSNFDNIKELYDINCVYCKLNEELIRIFAINKKDEKNKTYYLINDKTIEKKSQDDINLLVSSNLEVYGNNKDILKDNRDPIFKYIKNIFKNTDISLIDEAQIRLKKDLKQRNINEEKEK